MPIFVDKTDNEDLVPWLNALIEGSVGNELDGSIFLVDKVILRPKGFILEVAKMFAVFAWKSSKEGLKIAKLIQQWEASKEASPGLFLKVDSTVKDYYHLGVGDKPDENVLVLDKTENAVYGKVYLLAPSKTKRAK